MKDLALQMYIEYLQDLIQKHEESATLKDQLIQTLEDRVKIQDELISSLQRSLDDIGLLVGLPSNVPAKGTKARDEP